MIYASQFYNVDQNNDANNIIDALWCQSANNGTNIGVWYYPNGTEVPLFDGSFIDPSAPSPLFSKRFSGQIALARRGVLFGYEGLYKCIIPDENGVNQTLVVGAYTDTGYNNNDGPDADPTMQFSLLSTSRLATPPVFSLSFNVSDGPPTTVSCSVNGNGISTELSRVIVNGLGSVTRVTVVNLTEAGNYQCTVSNDRVTNGPISGISGPNAVSSTSSLSISVSDAPTGLTATRLSTGLAHVRLSWSIVSGATGYEIYSKFSTLTPFSAGTTALTTINITSGLFRGITYTFYVVSYGSASLPSGNASVTLTFSNPVVNDFIATLITSTTITLTWSPPTAVVPISYNIVRDCRRVCESSVTSSSETSVSSPHTSTGIPPYSQCGFDLIGVYGSEIYFLIINYLANSTLTAPTAPVGDIIFSSEESVSMTVSWDEVPCNGRNGPITGYYLTYTNITSNTSYTFNITGGDNRMYNLTGLIPYTNYTVSIIPYNYNMTGPARQELQLTAESTPGVISNPIHARDPDAITIVWNPPTIPNGIITVYEIRYREPTSTGPYNITNTTNTYYEIVGLIPNTSYTIGVRAYTSIGPGEWTDREYSTAQISSHTLAPTAPVGDIIFSSVESVSMTVSWDEVPCNGRNGPITGYYLTYTSITSNTSYTVNITGGDNRMYNLTGLIPYTNYTVSIIPYNYNMNGPARQEIQLTAESIPDLISDLRYARDPDAITIVWNPPTIPNGIITVYEIRYRESTSTGPYSVTNTTDTLYSIQGLIPNTSYTIGVRAYTSIGPGQWTDREYSTLQIFVLEMFSVMKLSSTAVRAKWNLIRRASHYTVYYESTSSSSRKKRQVETGMRVFPGDTTEGLIGGLDPNLNYLFSISISYTVNGIIYEGERTQPIPPGVTLTPTIVSSTSSVITS
uniref:Uncharacterized protein n=1 Tax=Amphimedon queenslandica TaxID=400682 RepID=A0A1X7TGV5_AMPQE